MRATVIAIFSGSGNQTRAESRPERTTASRAVSSAIRPNALMRRPSLRPSRRVLRKLPRPLETSMEKITTVRAYVGWPRKSTNF